MTLDEEFPSFIEVQLWELHKASLLLNTPTHLTYTINRRTAHDDN